MATYSLSVLHAEDINGIAAVGPGEPARCNLRDAGGHQRGGEVANVQSIVGPCKAIGG